MRMVLACCLLWLVAPLPLHARTIHWTSLSVDIRVDAQGALHVTERHAMVFDGEWNGGERSFMLRDWHDLDIESLTEIAPDGRRIALRSGDLGDVNEYKLTDGRVLRWRARLPGDPPFRNTPKTYEISYTLEGAIVPDADGYLLDHDVAFSERPGEIERLDAQLQFAPEWQPTQEPGPIHREHLRPGRSEHIVLRLKHVGRGEPTAVADIPSAPSATGTPALRYAAVVVVFGFVAWSASVWLRRERQLGRFEPAIAIEAIDEQWLARNVFHLKAEIVGAAWDRAIGASEVAALLARLTVEGKLSSSVRQSGWGPFKREVLELTMLSERSAFEAYERELIDKLFFGGSRRTDTEAIRSHYKRRGFDPVLCIAYGIRKQIWSAFAPGPRLPKWRPWLTAALVVSGIALIIASWQRAEDTVPQTALALAVLVLAFAIGVGFGRVYAHHVFKTHWGAGGALIVPALLCAGLAYVLLAGPFPLSTMQLFALPLATLGVLNSVFSHMHTRATADGIRLRRALGAARRYFERELRAQQPRLEDAWFPYLLAFGLGPRVDRWFKAFGGASGGNVAGTRSSYSSASSGSSGLASSTWTGGGGMFGGAGATGSWSAAVAGVAAGVAAPSSSSGSGSSSGGSSRSSSSGGGSSRSSGGGGGGGW